MSDTGTAVDPLGAFFQKDQNSDTGYSAGPIWSGDLNTLMGRAQGDVYGGMPDFLGQIQGAFKGGIGNDAAQAGYLAQLQAGAAGQGPSAAVQLAQLQQNRLAANMRGTAAAIGGTGGVAAGAALRNAMNQGAQSGLQSQQQIGALRAQEQLMQQQQLGQFLTQLRAQDIERQKAEADALAKATEAQYNAEQQQRGGLIQGFAAALGV